MRLTSPSFENQQFIPKSYTGEGEDVSPPLAWFDAPSNTREYAIVCEDPDAAPISHEDGVFVHWMAYNIPANTHTLPKAIPANELRVKAPVPLEQGTNSFGKVGYLGPMPPEGDGVHHYHFTLYALDQELGVRPALTRERLMKAMNGHILATAKLMGVYERRTVH